MSNNKNEDSPFFSVKQKMLQRGLETISIAHYKGFEIRLRAYNGVSAKIYGIKDGKRFNLRFSGYSFIKIETLFEKQKNFIDEYSDRLNEKLEKL